MTPNDFIKWLRKSRPGIVTLSPGPFHVRIGITDIRAARYLLQIEEQIDDDATIADYESVILSHVVLRLHEIAEEAEGELDGEAMWQDDRVQAMLCAWWWMTFWTAQAEPGVTWRCVWEWMKWPWDQVRVWVGGMTWRKKGNEQT
jgi:hypothetical protein